MGLTFVRGPFMRKAFTLIELLVVIAIIAILAAILFPVFSNAKTSAKVTQSISNHKQVMMATLMYLPDYDDTAMPLAASYSNNIPPVTLGVSIHVPYTTWAMMLKPYSKNSDILQDPMTKAEPAEAGLPATTIWYFRPQMGYAFSVFSPVKSWSNRGTYEPINMGSLSSAAETVMFISKKDRSSTKDWLIDGTTFWMASLVAPPFCTGSSTTSQTNVNPQSYCAVNVRWGSNGYFGGEVPTEIDGRYTGGVAIRARGKAVVAFADGHVKVLHPSQVASGTNWSKTTTFANIRITDKDKYMWDID